MLSYLAHTRMTPPPGIRQRPDTTAELDAFDEWAGYEDGKSGGSIRACRSEAYDRGMRRGMALRGPTS